MDETKLYQVRRYRMGTGGTGVQVASGMELEAAAAVAFHFQRLQDEFGGNGEFCVLPE